jgi:hypothetical protein
MILFVDPHGAGVVDTHAHGHRRQVAPATP